MCVYQNEQTKWKWHEEYENLRVANPTNNNNTNRKQNQQPTMCIYFGRCIPESFNNNTQYVVFPTWNNTNNTFTCVYYINIYDIYFNICMMCVDTFFFVFFYLKTVYSIYITPLSTHGKISIILFMFMKHTQHVTRQRNNLIRHCMWYSPIGTESLKHTKNIY